MSEHSARKVAGEADVDGFQRRLAKWLADVAEERAKMAAGRDSKRGGQAA